MKRIRNVINRREQPEDWKVHLDNASRPRGSLQNAIAALKHAPEWRDVLMYDEFSTHVMATRPPPWQRTNSWVARPWNDVDDIGAANWLQQHGIGVGSRVAAEAVQKVAHENSVHPVKNYLTDLEWDKVARIGRFAHRYLGAEDTKYHAAVGRCILISAVARVFDPGCKVDQVAILEGPQGAGKSQALDILFCPWFSDDLAELGSKDAAMQLRVAWGIEIAELSAMTRGEVERVKAFVSRRVDIFRPAYGRRVIQAARQSIFVGTCNTTDYLKDNSGNRRFLPLLCGHIDLAGVRHDRDQLWAEAVVLYHDEIPWWIPANNGEAKEQQELRRQNDAWEGPINEFCEDRDDVSADEILEDCLGIEKAKWGRGEQMRVGNCMKALGWERRQTRKDGNRIWRYYRPTTG
jgi:predicted P-loop ATPase